MIKKEYLALGLIFALVFSIRLYIAFGDEYLDYDAYFNLRQAGIIRETGIPAYNDELSYGGRFFTFLPSFHYLLAGGSYLLAPDLVAKILPNLLASLLTIVVFLVSRELTKNSNASLFSALLSGFIPIFFAETIVSASVMSFVVPLLFFLMYCFMKIQQNSKYVTSYIIFFAILVLAHPISIVLIMAIYFYLLICKLEKIKISQKEIELAIFSAFLWLWANLMIYKKAILIHGYSVIWQNLPPILYRQNFVGIDFFQAILMIGVLPFLFGIYIIYKGLYGQKNKNLYILVAFAVSIAIILWLKLISLTIGFIFLGAVLAVLFSQFYVKFFYYIQKTKLAHYWPYMVIGLYAVVIITSLVPSIEAADDNKNMNMPTAAEVEALAWLRENTPESSTILASPEEGHIIAYMAGRKTISDTTFILIGDLGQRLEDINTLYKGRFMTNAVLLLNKYGVNYIYLSPRTRRALDVDSLAYEDGKCITKVYDSDNIMIYKSSCIVNQN